VSTNPPTVIVSSNPEGAIPRMEPRVALWAVALCVVGAVLLQVSIMPYIRVADGIPDLVAATVACAGLLRGRLVGAVAGFSAGLLVELTAPIGTLGVLSLLYLVVGWFCGRYCERPESYSILSTMVLCLVAAGFVQIGYAGVHALLGQPFATADITARLVVPTLALTLLIAPPVVLLMRRLLHDPHVYEPSVAV
jgi:rod shape-determining protein MreD